MITRQEMTDAGYRYLAFCKDGGSTVWMLPKSTDPPILILLKSTRNFNTNPTNEIRITLLNVDTLKEELLKESTADNVGELENLLKPFK
jgi:hypothetical protein